MAHAAHEQKGEVYHVRKSEKRNRNHQRPDAHFEIVGCRLRSHFTKSSRLRIDRFLLASFIGDLVDGTFTNGSDERYLAEDWFNRCGFERDDKRTLLWHLLEQNADLENFIELYEENEEYKSHPEEFEEQREEYEMEPGDTFDFEDELQYWLDDWKPSKLSMAEEVEAVRDYVQAMKNFKGE